MDLPSELLLNIAEYEPQSRLDLDPVEIVRRIMVVNPKFDLESYLLRGLELANRQASVQDTLAYDLYLLMRDIDAKEYSVAEAMFDPNSVSVTFASPDEPDASALNVLFGRELRIGRIMTTTILPFLISRTAGTSILPDTKYIFEVDRRSFPTLIEDTIRIANTLELPNTKTVRGITVKLD